ncbi:MAG: phosphotransferase [Chloroflexi bacterium]|nr:phosphotransferase [Chloroflexota bacterium]MBP8057244.1 phosphotransferase [Chloroflexota bacterium]
MYRDPDDAKFNRLVQKIVPQGRLRRVWPLLGGLAAVMHGLEVALPDGGTRKLVVRRFGGEALTDNLPAAANEFHLLHITRAAGLPTPTPYYFDISGEIFPTPYLVIEYMEGEMLFAPTHTDLYVTQLATHLARIHQVDGVKFDLTFLPVRSNCCPELGREPPAPVDPVLNETQIRQVLTAVKHLPPGNAAALLHGDFWPGNSLWQGDKLVAVIDWEDAEWGDPLIDLARSRAEIAWIFGLEAMHQFTTQYQALMSLDYSGLPYWDLCAALRFIRLFGTNLVGAAAYFTPFGRPDLTAPSIRNNICSFVEQAIFAG